MSNTIESKILTQTTDLKNSISERFYLKFLQVFEGSSNEVDVNFSHTLKNGLKLSTKFLHGPNCKVKWSGSLYSGEMARNKIEGDGVLSLPELGSTYKGHFSNGLFSGKGILECRGNKIESNFVKGFPCGETLIEFSDGGRFIGVLDSHGRMICGERTYPNGVFFGTFDGEQRRERGVYVFHDHVFTGSFIKGRPNGYCEVIWQIQDTLSLKTKPLEEFSGDFLNGIKFGVGVLKWKGLHLMTVYHENKKHGPGLLIASNGDFIVSNPMFKNDTYCYGRKVKLTQSNFESVQKLFRYKQLSVKRFKKQIKILLEVAIEINQDYPFFYPDYLIDLTCTPIISFVKENYPNGIKSEEFEFQLIQQVIKHEYFKLKQIYQRYACFLKTSDESSHNSNYVMNRLEMWQFLRDIGVKNSLNVSIPTLMQQAEIEFHIIVLNSNDYRESVEFNAFLRYLLYLTLLFNKALKNLEASKRISHKVAFGRFATMFVLFLKNVIYNVAPFSNGSLAIRVLNEDKSLCQFLSWAGRIKDPFSLRTVFEIVSVLKEEKELSSLVEDDLKVSESIKCPNVQKTFSHVTVKEIKIALRELFPQCFSSDGDIICTDMAIDGFDVFEIFERVLKIGMKKVKLTAAINE